MNSMSGILIFFLLVYLSVGTISHAEKSGFIPLSENSKSVEKVLELGQQALQKGQNDLAQDYFMQAYQHGMSLDSLYYFLAEAAFGKCSYDTAMAFNLTIRTPAFQPMRNMVLQQRYKLYSIAGLSIEAAQLRDSLPQKLIPEENRIPQWDLKWSSGYDRENYFTAYDYPFSQSPEGLNSTGWLFKQQGNLLWPLLSPKRFPLSSGVGYEIGKNYYYDSLDYRINLKFKVEHIWDSLSLTLAGQMGQVTSIGHVYSYRTEISYLNISEERLMLANAGIESEYNSHGDKRFTSGWLTWYHDGFLQKGKGFAWLFSFFGVQVDQAVEKIPLLYVDDVSKPRPTHFKDNQFQDSIPYQKITAYQLYTNDPGSISSAISPQSFISIFPNLSYTHPLYWNWIGEINSGYALTIYPKSYTWLEAKIPQSASSTAAQSFRSLVLNQVDGKYYSSLLRVENGGIKEYYSSSSALHKIKKRIDQRAQIGFNLKRSLMNWGYLTLEFNMFRTWSNLSQDAAIWIPHKEYSAAVKWNKSWGS